MPTYSRIYIKKGDGMNDIGAEKSGLKMPEKRSFEDA